MLERLHMQDFAIADDVTLEFSRGFNIITGETGAGKSIILNAIAMAMGDRADQEMIRLGSEEAVVEALFTMHPLLASWLREKGFPLEDVCIVKRIVKRNGKNRVFINGASATLSQLKEITERLIDLNNQSEHQMLMDPSSHLLFLDYFGMPGKAMEDYQSLYKELYHLTERYEHFKREEREIRRKIDTYRFEVSEIEAVNPRPGEDETLLEEVKILEKARSIMEHTAFIDRLLNENDDFTGALEEVAARLEKLRGIGDTMDSLVEDLHAHLDGMGEASRALQRYVEGMELDEEHLDEVNRRLADIEKLKRKYGDSIEDVLAYGSRIKEDLAVYEEMTFDAESFSRKIEELGCQIEEKDNALSALRQEAARDFSSAIEAELKDIGMEQARFEVRFLPLDQGLAFHEKFYGPAGSLRAEFFIETNPGEGSHPLVRTASGGELSRILFALKSVIGRHLDIQCMIFDEIDSGIGGAVAGMVGSKLARLAQKYQLIVITHQPQIAALGERHFHVEKVYAGERTVTRARVLEGEEIVEEVARMISGARDDQEALNVARRMRRQEEPERA
ncbi:DNA repair protein RecN [Candidatus Mcinerneyibacteriota bacterium]|nr:DNA repair protein RecN [Candidatus Mcinerneyibacteriota bacterium]